MEKRCFRMGVDEAKKIVDYVCKTKGGCGAFREFADLILDSRKKI